MATGVAIWKRGMEVDAIYGRCGMEKKTREHLFFHCSESALIWKLASVQWDSFHNSTDSLEE